MGRNVGVDVFPLVSSSGVRFRGGVAVAKTGRKVELAVTQEHGALEGRGADILRQSTSEDWKKNASNADYFKRWGSTPMRLRTFHFIQIHLLMMSTLGA